VRDPNDATSINTFEDRRNASIAMCRDRMWRRIQAATSDQLKKAGDEYYELGDLNKAGFYWQMAERKQDAEVEK
jgi:hypothetical protein